MMTAASRPAEGIPFTARKMDAGCKNLLGCSQFSSNKELQVNMMDYSRAEHLKKNVYPTLALGKDPNHCV